MMTRFDFDVIGDAPRQAALPPEAVLPPAAPRVAAEAATTPPVAASKKPAESEPAIARRMV
jgi:hypothetical protein